MVDVGNGVGFDFVMGGRIPQPRGWADPTTARLWDPPPHHEIES